MRMLQAILVGLTAGSTVMSVAWCFGLDLTVRGEALGYSVIFSLCVAILSAAYVFIEGGAK